MHNLLSFKRLMHLGGEGLAFGCESLRTVGETAIWSQNPRGGDRQLHRWESWLGKVKLKFSVWTAS